MEIFKTRDNEEGRAYINGCLNPGHEGLCVVYVEDTHLSTGVSKTSDKALARELGIPIWEGEHLGGSLVNFHGDLSLVLTTWGHIDFGERLFTATADYLRGKGIDVSTDNNDVLADGKKVMSWARATTKDGWVQSAAHFSVNTDLDLIRQICTKPMAKEPGALSKYGVTADDLYDNVVTPILRVYGWDIVVS